MRRIFEPMRKQVEALQRSELADVTATVVIYKAFVYRKLEAPKHLAEAVHGFCFELPSRKNSVLEQSAVSPMRSRRHSSNWIRFINSRRSPSWDSSWYPRFSNRFDIRRYRPGLRLSPLPDGLAQS